jgi:PAS domain S-box-containing protein
MTMEMIVTWNYRLVTLSVVIAIIGSYVALDFATRMRAPTAKHKIVLFVIGALTMGLAIWTMHFVGMLAMYTNMPMSYDPTLSSLSILAATIGAGIAFSIMKRKKIGLIHLFTGSIAMGIAICTMHYIGMASMKMGAVIHYTPSLFVLSIVIAIVASAGALWIAFQLRTNNPRVLFYQKIGGAVVMGIAISSMHYTGMAAANYTIATHVASTFTSSTVGNFTLSDLLIIAGIIFGIVLVILSSRSDVEFQTVKALNTKISSLMSRYRSLNTRLKKSEEMSRLMIDSIKDYAIFLIDPNGIVTSWNKGAERIKGYTADEIVGKNFSVFYLREALQKKHPQYELKMALEHGEYIEQGFRVRKDGSIFWANVTITPVYKKNQLIGFSKIVQDLTEQKKSKERLDASIKELESFSYSVSHDLRAPLRSIDGFSKILLERYGEKLDEEGRHFLDRVRKGTQQMGQLIDDLLNLSSLARKELNIEEKVDLTGIAKEIIAELQRQEPERQVEMDIGEGIFGDGDKHLLRIVLQNLLENAWKFTSHHAVAHIVFKTTAQAGKTVYYVKDDGAGFDMAYVKKLFGAFQRLHQANEFQGTGVGLAIAQQIIKRHLGKIWAKGDVEKGAIFYFTLGKRKDSNEY